MLLTLHLKVAFGYSLLCGRQQSGPKEEGSRSRTDGVLSTVPRLALSPGLPLKGP